MPFRVAQDLDDAVFDVSDVRVLQNRVHLEGFVDEPVPGIGVGRLPVTLIVTPAVDVVVEDGADPRTLILEDLEIGDTRVVLTGVIPCRVVVTTAGRGQVRIQVGEVPRAVRRLGRWRPWSEADEAAVEKRVVRFRMRTVACPACSHQWDEHPGSGTDDRGSCDECEYEFEHEELSAPRAACGRRVPPEMFAPSTPGERARAATLRRRIAERIRRAPSRF